MKNRIIQGDSFEELKLLAANSVDSVVTDAPYGLGKEPDAVKVLQDWIDHGYHEITGKGFMGKEWDAFVPQPAFWKEALRVLKPGGHALVFAGTRTVDWMGMSLRLAGFEIRDSITWIYGSGMPHGPNLKPAHEPILVVRKPHKEKSDKANVEKWGTGKMRVLECKVPLAEGEDGYVVNTFDNGAKPFGDAVGEDFTSRTESSGRFPANIIHDGQVDIFPDDKAKYFYCAKPSKREKNRGLDHLPKKQKVFNGKSAKSSTEMKDVEKRFTTQPVANTHETVKPVALMKHLVQLITPVDGVVLDPFAGSGTTGVAAKELGYDFILIEREAEYIPIIEGRLSEVVQPELIKE